MNDPRLADQKLYAERDLMAQGEHYARHIHAMTAEGLHAKSDIAAELAHRDIEIDRLQKLGEELAFLLQEARNERDMYRQQRADWKAAYDGLLEQRAGVTS